MRRLLLIGLLGLGLLGAGNSYAAIAVVGAGVGAGAGAGGGTFTTGTYDTTGANFIACGVSATTAAWPTITDFYGNTPTITLTKRASGAASTQIIYFINPTVGASHTFTATGTSSASIACLAFS